MPLAMPPSHLGPPNQTEAAAAHGFSSPPQFRPPPIDATRAHSLGSQQSSPLSPTGMFSQPDDMSNSTWQTFKVVLGAKANRRMPASAFLDLTKPSAPCLCPSMQQQAIRYHCNTDYQFQAMYCVELLQVAGHMVRQGLHIDPHPTLPQLWLAPQVSPAGPTPPWLAAVAP